MKIRLSSLAAFKLEKLIDYLEDECPLKAKQNFLHKLKTSLNSVAK